MSTYQLNGEHLTAKAVTDIARLRTTFLERLAGALASWAIPPKYAAVFGSAGRGQMTISSDIDILLVRPDRCDVDTWGEQVGELAGMVSRWTANDTRPLEFTASELGMTYEPVLQDVDREGLTVYGEPSWFRRRLVATRPSA